MGYRFRLIFAISPLLSAASFIGCSQGTPPAEPRQTEPAITEVDLSPLGEDLRNSVLNGEQPFKRGGWMGRLEQRVPGFSVSSPETAIMNGTLNGHPQNSFTARWKTNDPALTRVAFEAMLPKLFDEIEEIVAEVAQAHGAVKPPGGGREPTADGLPQLSILYESGGNVGWVRARQGKSSEWELVIDLIEEPQ